MPLTPQQMAFVNAYLRPAASAAASPAEVADDHENAPSLLPIWRKAKESTDGSISALQKALKGYAHPDLDRIADFGLNGITEGNQVAMMRALMEYDSAPAEKKGAAGSRLLSQVDAYRSFLDRSELITLVEKNPLGVAVTIRKPLSAALQKIAKAVA